MEEQTLLVMVGIVVVIIGLALYFLPAIIAYNRKHSNKGIILLLDFLIGWTLLGWVGCLIWAFLDTDQRITTTNTNTSTVSTNDNNMNRYENLEKLMKLKENGVLTEVEYEIEKAKLLK